MTAMLFFSVKLWQVFTRKTESNFVCPVQPEPEAALLMVPKERSFRTNGIFPDAPLSKF